jgi:hypothetical protein
VNALEEELFLVLQLVQLHGEFDANTWDDVESNDIQVNREFDADTWYDVESNDIQVNREFDADTWYD